MDKKISKITRGLMTVLTVILIALFLTIMVLVSKIQGTARVVNYAGLVRGKTQRIIKLEDAKEPQDEMIESVASFIEGLRYGSDELNLVRLDDRAFQNKMKELDEHFQKLQKEIRQVRKEGYENTEIIEKSETFFVICDEATGLAEKYAQKKATALERLEKIVIADIIGLVCLLAYELIKAVKYAAQNKALKKKVYLDEATGLPNKNRCEEILDGEMPECTDGSVALCVFDMNNLRIINNRLGHDQGDAYIRSFAVQLRKALPEEYFAEGLDEDVRARVLAAGEKLKELGATVETFSLGMVKYAVPAYYILACAEASSNLSRFDGIKYGYRADDAEDIVGLMRKSRTEGFGPEVRRRILLGTFVLSSGYYDAYYVKALKVKALIKKAFDAAFEKFDVILSPAAPTTALPVGQALSDPLKMYLGDIYTVSVNLAGLPAVTMPCGFDKGGLPVGAQLIGKPHGEGTILNAAHTYQLHTDFHKKVQGGALK